MIRSKKEEVNSGRRTAPRRTSTSSPTRSTKTSEPSQLRHSPQGLPLTMSSKPIAVTSFAWSKLISSSRIRMLHSKLIPVYLSISRSTMSSFTNLISKSSHPSNLSLLSMAHFLESSMTLIQLS